MCSERHLNQRRCKCSEDGFYIYYCECDFRVTTDNFQPTNISRITCSELHFVVDAKLNRLLLAEPTVQPEYKWITIKLWTLKRVKVSKSHIPARALWVCWSHSHSMNTLPSTVDQRTHYAHTKYLRSDHAIGTLNITEAITRIRGNAQIHRFVRMRITQQQYPNIFEFATTIVITHFILRYQQPYHSGTHVRHSFRLFTEINDLFNNCFTQVKLVMTIVMRPLFRTRRNNSHKAKHLAREKEWKLSVEKFFSFFFFFI